MFLKTTFMPNFIKIADSVLRYVPLLILQKALFFQHFADSFTSLNKHMRVCGLLVLEGEFSCSRSAITSNTKCHVSRQRLPVDSARFIRPLRALRARFSWNDRRGARCGCRDEKSVEALAEAARLRSRQWLSISPRGRRLNRKLPMNRDDR